MARSATNETPLPHPSVYHARTTNYHVTRHTPTIQGCIHILLTPDS